MATHPSTHVGMPQYQEGHHVSTRTHLEAYDILLQNRLLRQMGEIASEQILFYQYQFGEALRPFRCSSNTACFCIYKHIVGCLNTSLYSVRSVIVGMAVSNMIIIVILSVYRKDLEYLDGGDLITQFNIILFSDLNIYSTCP